MVLNFMDRSPVDPPETGEVAFLTPKRLGSATVRNRLRRRMREIYRRELALDQENSFLVWIARPSAIDLSFDELRQAMTALMEKRGR